jgi:hypothetical protein
VAWVGVFATLSLAAPSSAVEARFIAPTSCPSEDDLLALVRARLAPGVESIPDFRAQIRARAAIFSADLRLENAEPRRLTATSCDEVIEALAIILALRAERLHAEQSRVRELDAPAPSVGWLPPPVTPPAASDAPSVPREIERAFTPESNARGRGSSWRLRFGAGAVISPSLAPGTAVGPAVVAVLEWPRRVALRLQFDRSATGEISTPPASIWARLSALRLTGCAFELSWEVASITPCIQLAAGRFEAGGVPGGPISSVREVGRPWLSVGPALRLELPLNSRLRLGAEAAAALPLIEQTLEFEEPDATLHRSPTLSSYFGLSAEFVLTRSKPAAAAIAR